MIYNLTLFKVSDNSGIKRVQCIKIYKKNTKIGSFIYTTVQNINIKNRKGQGKKLSKGSLVKAVIIRSKKIINRNTGNSISFDSNEVVLLDEKHELFSTRIFGPVPLELRKKGFGKLVTLASSFL